MGGYSLLLEDFLAFKVSFVSCDGFRVDVGGGVPALHTDCLKEARASASSEEYTQLSCHTLTALIARAKQRGRFAARSSPQRPLLLLLVLFLTLLVAWDDGRANRLCCLPCFVQMKHREGGMK